MKAALSVISLMRTPAIITTGMLMFAMVGCGQPAISARDSAAPEQQPLQPVKVAAELHDIGAPDDSEREVDGIHISGSALTDDHIAAIKKLTDDTKPTNPNRYLIRGIEHTGLNTATNIWQTGHSQVYQKLRLVNGKWEIEEEGGGFGQW